jgi:hypothetical protein
MPATARPGLCRRVRRICRARLDDDPGENGGVVSALAPEDERIFPDSFA